MRVSRLFGLLGLLAAGVARADVPNVVLTAVEGKSVVVERADGSTYAGTLASFDETHVSLILPSGAVVAVARKDVTGVRIVGAAPVSAPRVDFEEEEEDEPPRAKVTSSTRKPEPEEEIPLSPGRAALAKSLSRLDKTSTWVAAGTLGGSVVLGVSGGFAGSDGVVGFGGFMGGAGANFANLSPKGRRYLVDGARTDEEVASQFRTHGVLNLALFAPLWFGAGTFLAVVGPNVADTEFMYYAYQYTSGIGFGAAAGSVSSGILDLTTAGRVNRLRRGAWVAPPSFAFAPLRCETSLCGGALTVQGTF
jgi:hypothetical protein